MYERGVYGCFVVLVCEPVEYGALFLGELGAGCGRERLLKVAELSDVAAHGVLEGVAAFEELVVLDAWVGLAEYNYLCFQGLDVFEDFCVFGGRNVVGFRLGGNIHLSCVSPDVVSTGERV